MTETRICWEQRDSGFDGYAGTLTDRVFEIYAPTEEYEPWRLAFVLPRIPAQRYPVADDPEAIKAEAERWLAEFVSSLGAVFLDDIAPLAAPATPAPLAGEKE